MSATPLRDRIMRRAIDRLDACSCGAIDQTGAHYVTCVWSPRHRAPRASVSVRERPATPAWVERAQKGELPAKEL